jgi:hypothetical protein
MIGFLGVGYPVMSGANPGGALLHGTGPTSFSGANTRGSSQGASSATKAQVTFRR